MKPALSDYLNAHGYSTNSIIGFIVMRLLRDLLSAHEAFQGAFHRAFHGLESLLLCPYCL